MNFKEFTDFLDKLYAAAPECVFLCGGDGAILYKNPTAKAITAGGAKLQDYEVFNSVCNSGAGTYEVYTPGGKCFCVDIREVEAGQAVRLFIMTDKTEQTVIHKRLLVIESMFFSSAQCFPGSTLLIDKDFKIEYANGTALKSQPELFMGKGADVRQLYNTSDLLRIQEVFDSGVSQHYETSQNGLILDSYLFPINCTGYNFSTNQSELVIKYVLDMTIDITDKRLIEKKLAEAKRSLELSEKSRRDFISRFSHELRTPMNAIIGMTYVARASEDGKKIQNCLQKIDESANSLLKIIGDILDISSAESGTLAIANAKFMFEDILKSVVEANIARIREKKIAFDVMVSPDICREYTGDAARLGQALNNLVGNAVKFTPEGGEIQLSAACGRSLAGTEQVLFTVSDNGIGIAEEHQSRIFESFRQLDGGISRKHGGVGAGLAVTKSIITAMDGSISLFSRPGKGTTFTFDVWLGRVTEQKIFSHADLARKLSVVVIDRREHCRAYLSRVFSGMGFECRCVETAGEALDLIAGAPKNSPVNLVIADYSLPHSDGIAAAEKIKQLSDDIRVLLVSSYAIPDLRFNSKKTPYDNFAPKPLLPTAIILGINKCFGDNSKLAIQLKAAKQESGTGLAFPRIPGVDVDAGLKNAGNNPKLYRMLLLQFCDDSLAHVTRAYKLSNSTALAAALKVFGEQSLNLGLKALAEFAYEMERVINYNVASDVLDKSYERILSNYRQVCQNINVIR